tara:strand:- start:10596 stop:11873 length:1278 start_codon:yes stop_codon:yes gene_type:complete
MIFKLFLIILNLTIIFGSLENYARELSIEQIEERKKIDLERKIEREKRGIKKFKSEIKLSTEIIFLTKEREIPPVLSNLDPILTDEGYYGVTLAIEDNLTTGNFLGHDYKYKFIQISLDENLDVEFSKLLASGYKYFIANLNTEELKTISNIAASTDVIIMNVGSKSNSLRNENCSKSLFHIPPTYSMLADSLTQFLVKKKWKKWFLVTGPDLIDKEYADSLKNSAVKFNIKIKDEKTWDFSFDLRRTAQKEVPLFTKGVNYDILVVADEKGEFGEYLQYRTWYPKIVAGTQGLKPTAWHRTHEQWGATQMQNRFRRKSGRWMTEIDYFSWVGVRAIGEAITRVGNNNVDEIKNFLLSDSFGIGAYKGVKVSFRDWNGQLRQPILLASPRSMVSVSPQEGYLHPSSELDTLGMDEPESTCKIVKK